jgi:hypothetical protein
MTLPMQVVSFAGALAGFAAVSLAGPDWVEGSIDAGGELGSAQITTGSGSMSSISGNLSGARVADFEDMFLVRVLNPVIFQMTTGTPTFDPQLFIFNVTQANEAFGLLANDNTVSGPTPQLLPMATDGTQAAITQPGVYAIAISAAGRYPISMSGAIFFFGSPTEISGPDGPGGINPHIGWAGPGGAGTYQINVTGVGFHSVPGPGAGALLVFAAGLAARRRRR